MTTIIFSFNFYQFYGLCGRPRFDSFPLSPAEANVTRDVTISGQTGYITSYKKLGVYFYSKMSFIT